MTAVALALLALCTLAMWTLVYLFGRAFRAWQATLRDDDEQSLELHERQRQALAAPRTVAGYQSSRPADQLQPPPPGPAPGAMQRIVGTERRGVVGLYFQEDER